jgi:mannose-6-phosphate isomerase-like protein (cupin superfamily)
MISKIERGEVSPTAAVLARLAAGLSVSLASLFAEEGAAGGPLARAADQPAWTDPATGYVRRNVSPPAARAAAEIVDVTFPAGGRVMFDNAVASHGLVQQVWVIEGVMEMTVGGETTRLAAGDCLFMTLDRPIVFANPGPTPARYAVVLSRAAPI